MAKETREISLGSFRAWLEDQDIGIDRESTINFLKRAGGAEWALILRAYLEGGSGYLTSAYVKEKIDGIYWGSVPWGGLDEERLEIFRQLREEYFESESKRI